MDLTQSTIDFARNVGDLAGGLIRPTVRLGVTGLARAGKTVFIAALIQNLIAGGRLPFFNAVAQGRVRRAFLEPQPDDAVARFQFEDHLAALTVEPPSWPESTRRISELRLTLEYKPQSFWKRALGYDRLHIDLVDYPGEWLLDLPLLNMDYAAWSLQALILARARSRAEIAREWLVRVGAAEPAAPADEQLAGALSDAFKAYLARCREDPYALSTVPPGRFLMPGDLEGSPALTFAPLDAEDRTEFGRGSLWTMMERRYDAYRRYVVRPFFNDHFSRLDRQIVLVDTLAALNAGPEALADLEAAMGQILACFRTGDGSWLSNLVQRRIDRIVFAATKADHLHHTSHDRLEQILARLTASAIERARFSGVDVRVLALAAMRATREGKVTRGGQDLPCILGVPLPGETLGKRVFDGKEEVAIFPGDLPADPEAAIRHGRGAGSDAVRFIRFRPPHIARGPSGNLRSVPHIRLDRAMEALFGDRLE